MRQWLVRAVYAVLLAEIVFVVVFAATHRTVDFDVYMWGGRAVGHDTRLYLHRDGWHWFTYAPFAAILFAAATVLPFTTAQVLFELASVAAVAVAGYFALRLAGWRASRTAVVAVAAAGLLLEPVYHTLFNGQINTILLALVLADVWRVAQGRRAGLGVGIAAAIKLTPAIFVVLFLLARRTGAAVTATATFAVCTLIGYLVAPGASRLYWTRFFYDANRVDLPYIGNQSIYGALVRLLGGVAQVPSWYVVATVAVGIVGLATATVFARRGDWLAAASVTGVTGLLISPVSWTHHWVWVLPALALLARGVRGERIAAAAGYLLFALAPVWWSAHSLGRPDYGFHWLVTVVTNSYLIAGFAFLGYQAWRAYAIWRARPGAGASPGEPHGPARAEPVPDRAGQAGSSRSANVVASRRWPLALG